MEADPAATRGKRLAPAVAALQLDLVAAEVITGLREAGVRPILLKGPALAAWLYEGEFRPYGDVDLLVEEGRMNDAEAVLSELGFGYGQPGWRELAHSWKRPDGKTVDLHRSLVGVGAPPATLWQELSGEVEGLRVGGIEVETLRPPGLALHVALHAAQHGGEGHRKPLEDLDRALDRADESCWREAARLAERVEATPAFATGLRLTPSGSALADRLGLPADRPPEVALHAAPQRELVLALEYMATADGLGPRLRFLGRKLFPPAAELQTRLSARPPRAGRTPRRLRLEAARDAAPPPRRPPRLAPRAPG